MAKRIAYTIRDVARLARVSVSTASAVVNQKDIVSPELRNRVQQAIQAMGYSPNQGARGLRIGRTHIIGMVVPDITNPFYVELMRGVEDEAIATGYELMLCNSNDESSLESRHFNALRAQRVDGILFAPSDSFSAHAAMARSHVPVVLMDCIPIGAEVSCGCVSSDNLEAAYEATKYLIGLGHRRIAVISGRRVYSTTLDRIEGCQKAIREAGLPLREEFTWPGDSHIEIGYTYGVKLLQSSEPPTAIFALNNRMTLGVLRAFSELGIACPGRVSLISFDDTDWADVFNPSITAIAQPTYQMGKSAVELLVQYIEAEEEEGELQPKQVVLKSTLRIRKSTGPPPEA
jgi:LacI family transcriptional regulator